MQASALNNSYATNVISIAQLNECMHYTISLSLLSLKFSMTACSATALEINI